MNAAQRKAAADRIACSLHELGATNVFLSRGYDHTEIEARFATDDEANVGIAAQAACDLGQAGEVTKVETAFDGSLLATIQVRRDTC